jgi:hypothetical protein
MLNLPLNKALATGNEIQLAVKVAVSSGDRQYLVYLWICLFGSNREPLRRRVDGIWKAGSIFEL